MNPVAEAQALDRALAGACARLLAACAGSAGALGLACAVLAAAALLLRAPGGTAWGLLAVLAVAPVERLLALRLHFDAGLFADLQHDARPATLSALDDALHRLRLRRPAQALRSLADRAHGARRLIGWHAGCVTLQLIGLLVAAAPALKAAA